MYRHPSSIIHQPSSISSNMSSPSFGICSLTVVPCRKKPSHAGEMVTELLFGEHFEILEKKNNWFHIRNSFDKYESWVDSKSISGLNQQEYDNLNASQPWFTASMISKAVNLKYKVTFNLLIGSNLPSYDGEKFRIANDDYELLGKTNVIQNPLPAEHQPYERILLLMKELIDVYMGAPYLWGGRTPFGVDCSGFTQMIYKLCGVQLPRDSEQQSQLGEPVAAPGQCVSGDTAFFADDDGKITHTGIILKDDKKPLRRKTSADALSASPVNLKIVHASGFVRMDKFDENGIYNQQLRRYTHKLAFIKRHFK